MQITKIVRSLISSVYSCLLRFFSPIIVAMYGGFWEFRRLKKGKILSSKFWRRIYKFYQERYNCFIGIEADIESKPIFPHNLSGIFISNMSKIGHNVVIFQQVTIGSNTIQGHPRMGSPSIGDNVYIGAGAKIIGNVSIGCNCRIGAGCVVVKDMPANTTAVAAEKRFIFSFEQKDNTFIPYQFN